MSNEQVEHSELLRVAQEAAHAAGAVALQGFRGLLDIRSKGGQDIVTQYDTLAEDAALGVIRARFPGHAVLAEESGASDHPPGTSDWLWTVDPIDGTHNYAMQLPFWCSSVAAIDAAGRVVAGVIYDPLHGETFSASADGGAFLNGTPIHVAGTTTMSDAALVFDMGYDAAVPPRMLAIARAIQPDVKRLRLLGSAVLAMTYVAAGRLDAYYHLSLQPWDIAAASLLVREAGGIITDWYGKELAATKTSAVAANRQLQPQLLKLLHAADPVKA